MEQLRFGTLNYAVVIGYFVLMFAVGIYLAKRQNSTEEFFLAGRRMPWFIVAMSIFSSLTSAISYMGIPGMAYRENVSFILLGVSSVILAPFLGMTFYPIYRRLNVTTSYEYVFWRYGPPARYAVSALFVLARLGWLGTVLYAPAIALKVATGIDVSLAIPLIGILTIAYTVLGGLAAVMWIDVVQFLILVGGAFAVAGTLIARVGGGVPEIINVAAQTNHLHVFDLHFSFFEMTGIVVLLSYFFQLMQEYGTDQMTVQRLLSTKNVRAMARAVIGNSFLDLFVIGLLLFNGLAMFAYFRQNPGLLPAGIAGDKVLPFYIMHALPAGVSGLLMTAIFVAAMGAMDSGINVLTTVIVNDFIKPLRRLQRSEAHDVGLARVLTVVVGVFAIAVGWYASSIGEILKAAQTFLGLFGGPILALFFMGIATRRGKFWGWVVGVIVALPFTWWVQHAKFLIGGVESQVHFIYYFPTSFFTTLLVGYAASLIIPGPLAQVEYTICRRRPSSLACETDTEPGAAPVEKGTD